MFEFDFQLIENTNRIPVEVIRCSGIRGYHHLMNLNLIYYMHDCCGYNNKQIDKHIPVKDNMQTLSLEGWKSILPFP